MIQETCFSCKRIGAPRIYHLLLSQTAFSFILIFRSSAYFADSAKSEYRVWLRGFIAVNWSGSMYYKVWCVSSEVMRSRLRGFATSESTWSVTFLIKSHTNLWKSFTNKEVQVAILAYSIRLRGLYVSGVLCALYWSTMYTSSTCPFTCVIASFKAYYLFKS